MKRFLRSPLGATSYEGVTITWIRGRTPTLTVKRDGDEQDSIDLSPFNEEKLHALFVSKGPPHAGAAGAITAAAACPSTPRGMRHRQPAPLVPPHPPLPPPKLGKNTRILFLVLYDTVSHTYCIML